MDQSAPTLDQRGQGFCAMLQCGTRGAEGTERSAHLGRTDPQWPAPVARSRSRSRTAGGAGRTRKLVGEGGNTGVGGLRSSRRCRRWWWSRATVPTWAAAPIAFAPPRPAPALQRTAPETIRGACSVWASCGPKCRAVTGLFFIFIFKKTKF